ncbi:DUF397 domain-containing protein [Streptomyces sp. MUSC 14]|uniref:DUF397 domain-containing protein n=1 Tax=Streptomyces sp. MUSC 14 TaxID=1354889 RepID=UPI0008F59355|nr:DUF397 domain-containing protein [Streptomyces sp. MUSC 14]OIJ91057.1 DUF397 domain-containing protein [Streptomyces sp. MUSC 14]
MNVDEPTELVWFKSSYSSGEGGECVEVALAWRKSSYSDGEGGQCVEIATTATSIHIRDSKQNPTTAPTLIVPPAAWQAFLGLAQS